MTKAPDILCIGSVLWDIIGRSEVTMRTGSDMPGHITRRPGGVALNIAMALARFELSVALLSCVGTDAEGNELVGACETRGLHTDFIYRPTDLPTDVYMAVEGANGLIAAIADAHSLEKAGTQILEPFHDGRLPSPFQGMVALDGNLTETLLAEMAQSPLFEGVDLRVAPASPGKVMRLVPFVDAGRGTLYVNLEEAGSLCGTVFESSDVAAKALCAQGAYRVLVTNSEHPATYATAQNVSTLPPPRVQVTRITGAGDTFMAAHIAAEIRGFDATAALQHALDQTALYVSGETTI